MASTYFQHSSFYVLRRALRYGLIRVMTSTTTEHDMSKAAYEWAQAALITTGAIIFIIWLAVLVWDSATRMTG